ncbi:MAG: proline iminopeptidase-family hydrolase [Prolixibacteraceae bacterium]|jgi:proline iminopeptidase|nr:proline iminopeptidase-family hydrolase [Prolixibacteraceae bacterium]
MPVFLFCCRTKENQSFPSDKDGFVQVTGGKVWYCIVGANKKGIPLLILHGGPGVPHDYLEPLNALANERPVIFYDQLGCGNSEKPTDTTLWHTARFVEELEQVRAALQLDKVHILGQSWGTMLAVEYMLRKDPDGVVSLILSAPYLSTPRWVEDQKQWISQLPTKIQDIIRKYEANGDFGSPDYQDAMLYFYKKHVCRIDPWPDCMNRAMEKTGADVYSKMWGASEFTMTGNLKHTDLTGQLHQITVPVLFTCGEFDEATPTTTAFYQSNIPGSKIRIFKGASHEHHIENPTGYNQAVRDFLNRVEKK